MGKVTIVILLLLVAIACQKKAVPVITERKTEASKKVVTPFPPSGTILPDTAIGKTVFVNRCGKCHGLPEPVQYTAQKWEGILAYMMPRARLDEIQKIHVWAYVNANAAK